MVSPFKVAWTILKQEEICSKCGGTGKFGTDGRFGFPLNCKYCGGSGLKISVPPNIT